MRGPSWRERESPDPRRRIRMAGEEVVQAFTEGGLVVRCGRPAFATAGRADNNIAGAAACLPPLGAQ